MVVLTFYHVEVERNIRTVVVKINKTCKALKSRAFSIHEIRQYYLETNMNKKNIGGFSILLLPLNHCHSDSGKSMI